MSFRILSRDNFVAFWYMGIGIVAGAYFFSGEVWHPLVALGSLFAILLILDRFGNETPRDTGKPS